MTEDKAWKLKEPLHDKGIPFYQLSHYYSVAERAGRTNKSEKFRDDCFTVGLLHDVVEDGYFSFEEIKEAANLNEEQLCALAAITRDQHEQYFKYIERVSKCEIARKVKLADLADNIFRCALNFPASISLLERYVKAYRILSKRKK